MNSANAFHLRRPVLAASFLFLLVAGCGDYSAYPEGMKYPLRTDPIVKTPSKKASWYPDSPGNLDESIANLGKEDPGSLLYPKTIPAVDPQPKNNDRRYGRDRTTLAFALQDVFGTPRGPSVSLPPGDDTNLTIEHIEKDLNLSPPVLANGSVLYRRYCLQCHGMTGDGRGPTGPWVNPHPRDYRQGVFKFISTKPGIGKPSRTDLHHVLTTGVEGTSMPSFALLGDESLEAIISYIMHLSIRGEVELNLCKELLGNGEFSPDSETVLDEARTLTGQYVQRWYEANKKEGTIVPVPKNTAPPADDEARKKSIARGYEYFTGTQGGCVKCHMDFGRQVPFKADVWGTWVRPANLTNDVYRGGRRPIDIYWRIRAGIDPSGMPAGAGLMAGDDDTKVWDVVNFVQALPFPAMLPEDVRNKVYGKKEEKDQAEEK